MDVKNYKLWLNPVWQRILYSCIHMTPVGVKGLRESLHVAFCGVRSINVRPHDKLMRHR